MAAAQLDAMRHDRRRIDCRPGDGVLMELRVKLVAPDGREFYFPSAAPWIARHPDYSKIVDTSTLTRRHCKELWRYLNLSGPPPSKLLVCVHRIDLEMCLTTIPKMEETNGKAKRETDGAA